LIDRDYKRGEAESKRETKNQWVTASRLGMSREVLLLPLVIAYAVIMSWVAVIETVHPRPPARSGGFILELWR
jgi:hypothetical protein